jgi:rare lipoprotein A
MTAAHRTLPFGSRVRISDPKTGRSVTVVINDRGPFGKHRVLDVSPSAARALGMISRGVIYVQAQVL